MPGEQKTDKSRDGRAAVASGSKRSATDVRQPRTVDLRHRAPETAMISEGIRTLYG